MLTCPAEIEEPIARLAQMARARRHPPACSRRSVRRSTSSPASSRRTSPSRIAFRVASKTDSRTVLDMNGAENLLGHGRHAVHCPPASPSRTACTARFVSEEETDARGGLLARQGRRRAPCRSPRAARHRCRACPSARTTARRDDDFMDDELIPEAAKLVVMHHQGSHVAAAAPAQGRLLARRPAHGPARAARRRRAVQRQQGARRARGPALAAAEGFSRMPAASASNGATPPRPRGARRSRSSRSAVPRTPWTPSTCSARSCATASARWATPGDADVAVDQHLRVPAERACASRRTPSRELAELKRERSAERPDRHRLPGAARGRVAARRVPRGGRRARHRAVARGGRAPRVTCSSGSRERDRDDAQYPGGALDALDARARCPRRGTSRYLKISEGCDHRCTFCIIPQLRGDQRSSRSIESGGRGRAARGARACAS